jgi:prepilin-type N-terminal cleavage/methylation domain-containing protein
MKAGVMHMFLNEKAMTLIELLIVCVIISVAFLGLAGLFPVGMQNLNQSKMRTIATDLGQEKLEELLKLRSTDASLDAGNYTDPNNPVRTTFNRYWTITDDFPVDKMKKIEVRVTYPRGSDLRDVVIVTYRRD